MPLAGFAHRQGEFEGIWHDLYAKIFFLESEESNQVKRSVIVSADLIWWDSDRAERLRKVIGEKWGVDLSCIILHATHTHSGPQTSDRFVPSLGVMDKLTVDQIEKRILDAIAVAERNLEPVTIFKGVGECRVCVNRRRLVGERVIMAPNPDGPVDTEVTLVRFDREDGSPKAIWMHYACHPTCSDANFVSSEFPGVAERIVEEHSGAVVAYFQGCCGDVRPALTRSGMFYRGGRTEIEAVGSTLAGIVVEAMARPLRQLTPVRIWGAMIGLQLPVQRLPSYRELHEMMECGGLLGQWSRTLWRDRGRITAAVPMKLWHVRLSEDLELIAIPGEVVVEYGLLIKKLSNGAVMPIPYSNGMIGYIPTARQIDEGGYEAHEAAYYFGLPAPFAHEVEARMVEGFVNLIEKGRC